MPLKSQGGSSLPETTARFAHVAFPKGNAIMCLRDALGPSIPMSNFVHCFRTMVTRPSRQES
jgi:hypothetical protein